MRQSEQTVPSKSTTTRRAKLALTIGILVPAQVSRSTTTAVILVYGGGTDMKAEVTV